MKPISIHEYFWNPGKHPIGNFCVIFGDDAFLKFHAVRLIRDHVLEGEDAEFSLTRFEGASVGLLEVLKEVSTRSMFGGDRRLVLVEDADSFITKYRADLEDYADKPSKNAVLLLVPTVFPSNTKLFKKLVEKGLVIEAKALSEKELPNWIIRWGKHQHQVACDLNAADLLLQRIGPEHGLLDQELAKLSLMVPTKGDGTKSPITPELVEKAVGSWRSQSTFEMLDLALSGQTASAIRQLDRLLLGGENAIAILAQIAYTLRKLAAATRLILDAEKSGKKIGVSQALKQVGVKPFVLAKTEKQLMSLGRHRGAKLLDWLLQADLDLKGASRSDPRLILETLIVKIADPRLRTEIKR